jgi:uncharacterized FlaG/YvyC family protein
MFSPVSTGSVTSGGLASHSSGPYANAHERFAIVRAVRSINGSGVLGENRELTFLVDRGTHKLILRVVDVKTDEVILQLPTEEVLRLAERLTDGSKLVLPSR